MAYLANAGFDVFSMDMEGYGRSTRPTVMNDPCNLARAQQTQFVPSLIAAPCAQSFQGARDDDRVRLERHRRRRRLRPRAAARRQGQSRRHGRRADRAPAATPRSIPNRCSGSCCSRRRTRARALTPRRAARPDAVVFNTQSQKEFDANWDRQVGCADQYDKSVSSAVWSDMVASDSVGSTWGAGVRRAPTVPSWGFNQAMSFRRTRRRR